MRFADQIQKPRGKVKDAAVVGAIVQLGQCFDLLDTANTAALAAAYPQWRKLVGEATPLPRNEGSTPDLFLRRLDCAVLNWYMALTEAEGTTFHTVRGAFDEGDPIFEGSMLKKHTHIQICVRDPSCIIGLFRPS